MRETEKDIYRHSETQRKRETEKETETEQKRERERERVCDVLVRKKEKRQEVKEIRERK